MPIYAFKCTDCGLEEEQIVKMGTTESTCSTCDKKSEKLPSFMSVSLGLPNGHIGIRGKSRLTEFRETKI